jgi:putative oxidoreductase
MKYFMNEETGLAFLRVSLAVVFIAHAVLKFAVFGMAGSQQFFSVMGLWPWLAWVVTAIEFVAGMALLIGFYSRYAAAAMIPVLIGVTWVHAKNGWVFSAPNGGWEYPVFLIACCVALVLGGGGHPALRQD